MRYIFFIFFLLLNSTLFYFKPLKLWMYFIAIPLTFIICTAILLLFPDLYYLHKSTVLQLIMSILVIVLSNIMRVLFCNMVDKIVNFHKKFNSNNLEKNPIKFLINNSKKIKNVFCVLLLLLSAIMLLGNWLK